MASSSHPLADEKYVSFTTFKRNGDPVPVAVWFAELPDGSFGFTTGGDSWKVKRLRNNPKVLVRASNVRGVVKPGAPVFEGTATAIAGDNPAYTQVEKAVAGKYGLMFKMVQFSGWVQSKFRPHGAADAAIVVTLTRD
jgi:PPOX class probable F420-dependent enzyme